ncbi:MAG: AAA family ATPase [Candidatus Aegiribacteria sp.]|nr:AAA family ATPase [Candidatus Aegiribacteria sp.]
MGIRIERISINRGGPLKKDFNMKPADLNLIYGHNETGKTYVVETLIKFLFNTGKNTPWILRRTKDKASTIREWEPAGKVIVSGIENGVTEFKKTGIKLEDYRYSVENLPQDFSRLMVIRAGETRLSDTRDGVGRDVLKTFLSGEGTLDQVEKNISQTIREAHINEGIIEGASRGLIKNRSEIAEERTRLNSLKDEIDENASLGTISSLKKEEMKLNKDIKELEKAKRHHALNSETKLQQLKIEKDNQPSDKDIQQQETDINILLEKYTGRSNRKDKLKEFKKSEDDYKWTNTALEIYRGIMEKQSKRPKVNMILMILILAFLAVAVAGSFYYWHLMIGGAIGAFIVMIIRIFLEPKAAPLAEKEELKKLEHEFQKRFSSDLTDLATLKVLRDDLNKQHILAEDLAQNLQDADHDIETRKEQISDRFRSMTGSTPAEEEWDSVIKTIKDRKVDLENMIRKLENTLTRLDIPREEYLETAAEVEWDTEALRHKHDELTMTQAKLNIENLSLESLKSRLAGETSGNTTDTWEELLTALEYKQEKVSEYYRSITAEILAKIEVCKTINEFRNKENARIKSSLESETISKPLLALTNLYSGVILTDEGDLNLNSKTGDEFPLETLSTGASEQVHLALRTGFAELAMQQPAFLILDDAFQHSDWDRRKNLISHTLNMIKKGWQIFYFTMDDHIKELFMDAGHDLKKKFKSVELK